MVPLLERLMDLPVQISSDGLPIDRLRLALKTDASYCDPPAIEARDIDSPTFHIQAVPPEQPFISEATPLDIEVMSKAQLEWCHLISRLGTIYTPHYNLLTRYTYTCDYILDAKTPVILKFARLSAPPVCLYARLRRNISGGNRPTRGADWGAN